MSGYLTLKVVTDYMHEKSERDKHDKTRILQRMLYVNVRLEGQAYRMLKVHKDDEVQNEKDRAFKNRGIIRRILDANTRLMSMGYNKLIEDWKENQRQLREKLKFVILALRDKDSKGVLMAYNSLKQNRNLKLQDHEI